LIQKDFIANPNSIIYVISPYISTNILIKLLDELPNENVVVLTNWNGGNLVQGSSNLDLFPYLESKGWSLLINDNLHAKLYSAGLNSAWIGSANLTNRGMGFDPNEEVMAFVEYLDEQDVNSIQSLIDNSVPVGLELYNQYKIWLDEQEDFTPLPLTSPTPMPIAQQFTLDSLPWTFSPIDVFKILSDVDSHSKDKVDDAMNDLQIIGISYLENKEEFIIKSREAFFKIPFVNHLLSQLTTEWTRFGGMRTMMREACGGLDEVSRDDVTILTQNFYEWVEELDNSKKYEFGVPRRSQLIRLKE
jgi:hypothetical protein